MLVRYDVRSTCDQPARFNEGKSKPGREREKRASVRHGRPSAQTSRNRCSSAIARAAQRDASSGRIAPSGTAQAPSSKAASTASMSSATPPKTAPHVNSGRTGRIVDDAGRTVKCASRAAKHSSVRRSGTSPPAISGQASASSACSGAAASVTGASTAEDGGWAAGGDCVWAGGGVPDKGAFGATATGSSPDLATNTATATAMATAPANTIRRWSLTMPSMYSSAGGVVSQEAPAHCPDAAAAGAWLDRPARSRLPADRGRPGSDQAAAPVGAASGAFLQAPRSVPATRW